MHLPPIELCPICGSYVHRGQSQSECAKIHGCTMPADTCPLKTYFAAMKDASVVYKSRALNPFTY